LQRCRPIRPAVRRDLKMGAANQILYYKARVTRHTGGPRRIRGVHSCAAAAKSRGSVANAFNPLHNAFVVPQQTDQGGDCARPAWPSRSAVLDLCCSRGGVYEPRAPRLAVPVAVPCSREHTSCVPNHPAPTFSGPASAVRYLVSVHADVPAKRCSAGSALRKLQPPAWSHAAHPKVACPDAPSLSAPPTRDDAEMDGLRESASSEP